MSEAGTDQMISINTETGEIDRIVITHDTRTPEAEQYLKKQGKDSSPMKLDDSYKVGGFDLMRNTFEDATGLSMDFQAVLHENAIQEFIDKVFGGKLDVDIPFDCSSGKVSFKGKLYDPAEYKKGKQQLTGLQIVQFMKSQDIGGYVPEQGPHQRKDVVLSSIKSAFLPNIVSLWQNFMPFLENEKKAGNLKMDFDESKLFPSIPDILGNFIKSRVIGTLNMGKSIFIMDGTIGDGGMQWVTANVADNPLTKKEIDEGVYKDLAMEIPFNANPYAQDLVKDYWQSVRDLVKKRLTG